MSDPQHKPKTTPIETASMANPYKYKKKECEWEKVCKKYGEEDKSKLAGRSGVPEK
jgi:hypothetical protein